jgi:hypothetical protein
VAHHSIARQFVSAGFFLTREQDAQQLKEYITQPSVSPRNRQTPKRVKVLYLQ